MVKSGFSPVNTFVTVIPTHIINEPIIILCLWECVSPKIWSQIKSGTFITL